MEGVAALTPLDTLFMLLLLAAVMVYHLLPDWQEARRLEQELRRRRPAPGWSWELVRQFLAGCLLMALAWALLGPGELAGAWLARARASLSEPRNIQSSLVWLFLLLVAYPVIVGVATWTRAGRRIYGWVVVRLAEPPPRRGPN